MASVSAVSDVSEGPVLTLINKRIRNIRKKLNRITQLEESIAQGKTVIKNKEQQDLLNSKPSLVAVVDELEKFRQPLSVAVDEEINLAIRHKSESNEKEVNGENGSKTKTKTLSNVENETAPFKVDEAVEDLLSLIYFGSMFDVKSQNDFNSIMLTRSHERNCCLTYDYVTDDDDAVMLGESDLDLISSMSSLLISKPVDSSFSHQNALQSCIERAKLWIAKSEQGIALDSNVTYAALREKLAKIISSDYFKITPEMKATADVAAEAAGNYVFQVPVESAVTQHEQKENGATDFQRNETYQGKLSPDEDHSKQHEVEAENSMETPVQMERVETNAGGEEFKVYVPRRSHQNPRGGGRNNSGGGGGRNNSGGGGGRRGFSNGRGGRSGGRGGPNQNGHNQSNEQPGNYYPRNYHGGRERGGRGNGYAYNRQASGVETAES